MFRDLSVILIMASLAFVSTASGNETKPSDNSKPLDKVGEEAVNLLGMKANFNVSDVELVVALEWYKKLSGNPVQLAVSEGAAKKKVTLHLEDATLAEGLRQITAQTGAKYKVVKGEIQIATPEELEAIDKGKAEFKPAVLK